MDWPKELGDCDTKQWLKTKEDEWSVSLTDQETEEGFGLLRDKISELSEEELAAYAGGLVVPLKNNPPPEEFYEK